jgi:hypothetical protein
MCLHCSVGRCPSRATVPVLAEKRFDLKQLLLFSCRWGRGTAAAVARLTDSGYAAMVYYDRGPIGFDGDQDCTEENGTAATRHGLGAAGGAAAQPGERLRLRSIHLSAPVSPRKRTGCS